MLADALLGRENNPDRVGRLIELATTTRLREAVIVDRLAHHRSVYRPLLIYAWLLAFRVRYESLPREQFSRWDEALRGWCDLLESEHPPVAEPHAAWSALALSIAGKVFIRDAWTDLAADTFGQIARRQQPSGAMFPPAPSEHPETAWYNELITLHAMASYAVQAEDRTVAAAVERATRFHLDETQPDHATTQPWGLFALIWNADTQALADQMLHNVTLAGGGAPDEVSLILLSDCLYCLRLFL